MRMNVLTALLMAGTVVGCASNPPPPPPPVADATPPAPPPPSMGDMSGTYRGMADLADGSGPRCAKMTKAQSVRVRNNTFTLMGVKAMIGPDGTVTSMGRGGSITGMASSTGLDLMTMRGKCNYHYTLTKA